MPSTNTASTAFDQAPCPSSELTWRARVGYQGYRKTLCRVEKCWVSSTAMQQQLVARSRSLAPTTHRLPSLSGPCSPPWPFLHLLSRLLHHSIPQALIRYHHGPSLSPPRPSVILCQPLPRLCPLPATAPPRKPAQAIPQRETGGAPSCSCDGRECWEGEGVAREECRCEEPDGAQTSPCLWQCCASTARQESIRLRPASRHMAREAVTIPARSKTWSYTRRPSWYKTGRVVSLLDCIDMCEHKAPGLRCTLPRHTPVIGRRGRHIMIHHVGRDAK